MNARMILYVLASTACVVVIAAGMSIFVRQVQSGPEATITIEGLGEFGAGALVAQSAEERAAQKASAEEALMRQLTKEDRERFQRARKAMAIRGIWIGGDDLKFLLAKGMFVILDEFTAAGARTDLPEDKLAARFELSAEEKLKMAVDYDAAGIARLRELADKLASKMATPAELEEAKRHSVLRHVVKAAE